MANQPRTSASRGSERAHKQWLQLVADTNAVVDGKQIPIRRLLADEEELKAVRALCVGWGELTARHKVSTLQVVVALHSLAAMARIEATHATPPDQRSALPFIFEEVNSLAGVMAEAFNNKFEGFMDKG